MPGRVLCADADRRSCGIVADSLRKRGYEVETCEDGQAAFESLVDERFDLALIGVQIPTRDGFQILEEIRRQPAPMCDIPVFLLSSTRFSPRDEQRARAGGATSMLVKPVALSRLHSIVLKYVKEGPPRVETGEAVPIPSQSSPFEGDFRELDFASLLHHLHGRRATGAVVLRNARKRKVLQLREGYPVAVKSNLVGECLGNRLVERGVISQAEFDESVVRMKAGEGLQGQILVAMQVMEEQEIAQALLEQAEQKLFEIFRWKRGHYEFRPAAQLKGGIALPRDRSPACWVMRGVREHSPIECVDLALRRLKDRYASCSETPFYRLQDVDLDEVATAVLERSDGRQLVGSQLDAPEPVRRALHGLIATGLLQTRSVGRQGRMHARPAEASRHASAADERGVRVELAASAERMRQQNDFEVLELSTSATPEEIEAAFERMARGSHPDRFQRQSAAVRSLAEGVHARIEAAYERLRDPRTRAECLLELKKGARQAAQAQQEERLLEAEVEFQKGEAFLRSRSYEAALLCFGNALQRKPEEGEYHAHYGWCLFLIHQDESAMVGEAIEHVRRGLKLARDHDKPYLFLGRLHKATGNIDAAEKMFTRAVQIRPESVEALRELRLINMRRGKQGLIGRILRR